MRTSQDVDSGLPEPDDEPREPLSRDLRQERAGGIASTRGGPLVLGLAVLLAVSCAAGPRPRLDDHVVASPLSRTANTLLRNLVTECGSHSGRWTEHYTPGCATIWATQFGYRAGLQRERDDLTVIGQSTAAAVSAAMRGLIWDAAFGDVDADHPALQGFPALLVSGTLGGSGVDWQLFELVLDRVIERALQMDLDQTEDAGLATMIAVRCRLDPEGQAARLDAVESTAPSLDAVTGKLQPGECEPHMRSLCSGGAVESSLRCRAHEAGVDAGARGALGVDQRCTQ